MALMYTNQVFPFQQQPVFGTVPPMQAMLPREFSWKPLLLTAGAFSLAVLVAKAFENPAPVRRCGTCGKNGHDTRNCLQNPAKRVRLRMKKTGRCTCCNRRSRNTEAHHYAGPADGNKGREMCGSCHLHCGHCGDYRNMAINPRYCRL
jgi:hypothetical protein